MNATAFFPCSKFKGKLGSHFILSIYIDALNLVDTTLFNNTNMNEKIFENNYYPYFPIVLSQNCGTGNYFDVKK